MDTLNHLYNQFSLTPARLIFQEGAPQGPKGQVEKVGAMPEEAPEDTGREAKKREVKERHGGELETVSFTPKQAKEVLGSKAKLSEYVKKRSAELQKEVKEDKMRGSKERQIYDRIGNEVYQMLRALESDQKALQDIIATHLDSDEAGVAHSAVEMVKGNDDYFKGLFNNPKAIPLVKHRAFEKIKDEQFMLEKVLLAIGNNEDFNRLPQSGVDYYQLNDRASAEKMLEAIKAKPQDVQDKLYGNVRAVLERELYGDAVWHKWEK